MSKLRIFTDGACSNNPGPGGWAALFAYETKNDIISGNECATTNNRMELMAVVKALQKAMKMSYDQIELHVDSAYVVNAVTKLWLYKWQQNSWKTSANDDVKNRDLWECMYKILKSAKLSKIKIEFVKVKGHSGNTFNDMVDSAARSEVIIAKRKISKED